LTSNSPPKRRSLYEKIQGPEAVPIEALIERGDTAARRASADYLEFFRTRLPAVETLANALFVGSPDGTAWRSFYIAVHDLRSSSASAGYEAVSAISQSLEGLLVERDHENPLMRDVIKLHLDALSLAASNNAPVPDGKESARLIKDLGRAVDKIPRT